MGEVHHGPENRPVPVRDEGFTKQQVRYANNLRQPRKDDNERETKAFNPKDGIPFFWFYSRINLLKIRFFSALMLCSLLF